MYNKVSRIVAVIVIAAVIVGGVPVIMAAPPTPPAIWIAPENLFFDTAHNSVGDKFNVTIWVSTTGVSYVWQVKVTFNPAHIHAVRADYTGTGKSEFFTGHGSIPVTPTIDNTAGFVVHGESLVGADSVPATVDSTLFWIEFEIVAAPATDTLTSQIAVDPDPGNTFILDPDLNSVSGIGVGSTTYSFSPPPPVRDLAVIELSISNAAPKQGLDNVTITIVVFNNGTTAESFPVEIDLDVSVIGTLQVDSLAAGDSQTLTLEWNTTDASIGKHTIAAKVALLPGDTDSANNEKSTEMRIMSATGPNTDINGDGKVDLADIGEAAIAFGSDEDRPRWNPAADVNGDGVVNMMDIGLVAKDFWKK